MRQKRIALAAALSLLLLTARAAAECPVPDKPADRCVLKLKDGAETPGRLVLPPGFYMTPETYERFDAEFKRLQEAETRLRAERDSYRSDARPTWWWVATAAGTVASGILGAWLWSK